MNIDVPPYSRQEGVRTVWERGATIQISVIDGQTVIRADRAGLISLARHMLTLAQENVPAGAHVHYDDLNSLEPGSSELVIERA